MASGYMAQTRHQDGGRFFGNITDLQLRGSHWEGNWTDNKGTHRELVITFNIQEGTGKVEELGDHVPTQIWPGKLTVDGNKMSIDGDANGFIFGVNLVLD